MDEVIQNLSFYFSLQGQSIDPINLKKELEDSKYINSKDLYAQLAVALGYRCKSIKIGDIENTPLPLIVELEGHGSCVLTRIEKGACFVFKARSPRVPLILATNELLKLAEFKGYQLKKSLLADENVIRPLRKYFNKKVVFLVIASSLVIQVLGFSIPIFSQIIIDRVLVHQNISALHVFGGLAAIFACAELALSVARVMVTTEAAKKVDLVIGSKLYRSILEKPLAFYTENRVGDLVDLTRRSEVFKNLSVTGGIFNALDLIFTSVFLLLMVFYSVELTGVCLGFVALIVAINFVFERLKGLNRLASSDSAALITEALYGIESLKLSCREGITLKKIDRSLIKDSKQTIREIRLLNWAVAVNTWIQRVGMLSTLWFGAILVLDSKISMGQLIAFQMFASRVFHPIARSIYTLQELKKARNTFLEISQKISSFQKHKSLTIGSVSSINAEDLRFRYLPGTPWIADNLKIEVKRGRKIAIVGASGCGKSTLLKLLVNIHHPMLGRVQLNGVDIRQFNEAFVRAKVALVPQNSFIFNGSILENIAPLESVTEIDYLHSLARLVLADEVIESHPDMYLREISEAGTSLSGGQRQRLCLLRALASKPEILMLDEATSALDEAAETKIHNNLIEAFPELTIITVSHRPRSLEKYDEIFELKDGKLFPLKSKDLAEIV